MFDSLSDAREEHVAQKIQEFAVPVSAFEDLVAENYKIDLHQPIQELSTESVKYYVANSVQTNKEYFAIVFERNFNPDHKFLKAIINYSPKSIISPVAYSITRLSTNKVRHFVLIVEKYDYTQTLESKFDEIGLQNSRFITSVLLPFICDVLEFCEANNLNCGNINPKNIIFINGALVLREPYISAPHSCQEIPYLATELLDAHEYGRFHYSIAPDIFAAGVTMLSTYFQGLNPNENMDKLKEDRLNNSSFHILLGKRRLSDDIKAHIKGCLNDSVHDRWKLRNLQDWSSGKLLASKSSGPLESDIFAAVSFNGQNYSHYRSLASALYHQWDVGVNFLSEERVLKWIERGIGKSKVVDHLDELTSKEYATQGFVKALIDKDERLAKAIIALDPQGPYRFNGFGSHLTSLGKIFHYGYTKQRKSIQDQVIKIALKKSWEDIQKYSYKQEFDTSIVDQISEIPVYFSSQTQGCGVERVLYHLNPSLPCQSPIVSSEYILTLKDMLIYLEKLASNSSEKLVFDKHIISFIADKINLKREVFVNMLKDIPVRQDNLTMSSLAILVLASHHEPELELVNLSKLIGRRVAEFIENTIKNVRVKRTLEDKIRNAADEGDMAAILKTVSNPKIYQNDQAGYYKACRDVNIINKKIKALTNNNDVSQYGTLFGQRITVLLSYLLYIIIILFMVI